jgi:O-antigen/teichoic acid export membrane protein
MGSTTTGYYKAALLVAELIWFVPNAIQTTFLHSTSELWERGARERINSLSSQTTRYTLLLSTLFAIGIAALADSFVKLYFGAEFLVAVEPLIFLLPGVLGFAAARPIFAISQGKGELGIPIAATSTAAALNLILNLVLIPRFGMIGAATATSVGYGSMFGFHVWAARKVGFNPLLDPRLLRIVAAALCTAVPILALDSAVKSDVVSLLLVPPVGFLVFLAAAIASDAVDTDELSPILERFRPAGLRSEQPEQE